MELRLIRALYDARASHSFLLRWLFPVTRDLKLKVETMACMENPERSSPADSLPSRRLGCLDACHRPGSPLLRCTATRLARCTKPSHRNAGCLRWPKCK